MRLGGGVVLVALGAAGVWQLTKRPASPPATDASASSRAAASAGSASSASAASTVGPTADTRLGPVGLTWSRAYGTSADEALKAIAAGPAGVYAAVESHEPGKSRDGAVVAMSPSGDLLWEVGFTNAADLDLRAIGVSGDRVVVAGLFEKDLECEGKKMSTPGTWALFTAELAADTGKLRAFSAYGGKDLSIAAGQATVAVDAAGVVIAGAFGGKLDLGCGEKTATSALDGFVARLDRKDACVFARVLPGQPVESVGVDSSGHIAIAGAGPYVAKLDPKGNDAWRRDLGAAKPQGARPRVAVHPAGAIALAGWFESPADLGGGPLVIDDGADLVVARFTTDGKLEGTTQIKTKRAPCAGDCDPDWVGLATNDRGDALVALPFERTVEVDGRLIESAGASDLLLLELDPKGAAKRASRLGDAAAQCPPMQCRLAATSTGDTFYAGGLFLGTLEKDLEAVAGDAFLLRVAD